MTDIPTCERCNLTGFLPPCGCRPFVLFYDNTAGYIQPDTVWSLIPEGAVMTAFLRDPGFGSGTYRVLVEDVDAKKAYVVQAKVESRGLENARVRVVSVELEPVGGE